MAGRKVRDENEARELLAGLEGSGQRLAEWAAAHGVDGRSLQAWSLNLARQHRTKSEALHVIELVPRVAKSSSPALTVRCGALVVDVPVGFDDDHLARVLTVVASC